MNNKTNKILVLLLVITIGIAGYFYKKTTISKKYKVAFPYTQAVIQNTSFSCEAIVDSSVTGSKEESLTNGIESTVEKGTNKVSLQIKDNKMVTFLSGASFSAGETGVDFTIVKNDDKELVAAMWNNNSMNSVVINKSNGLAVWSKIRSDFPGYGAPATDTSYMICR